MKILLTGATGYVGGRLLERLAATDHAVRCLVRNPESFNRKADSTGNPEIVTGDVLDAQFLETALKDIDVAYYFIHSMGSKGDFIERDKCAALNFGKAASGAGVKRIIYLGGLGDDDDRLSPHLKSRHEVGSILRECDVQVIELRASIIIGTGSLSYEIMRSLVERLPVMVTPKWVSVPCQPVYIEEVLDYLMSAAELETGENRIYEIGGAESVSYGELMQSYAKHRSLRRFMIPVPVLTPYLSGLWLQLITPVQARTGRILIEGLSNETVVKDKASLRDFNIKPSGVSESIGMALKTEDEYFNDLSWAEYFRDGGSSAGAVGKLIGTRYIDSRVVKVNCGTERAFAPVREIGGEKGWYCGNWLWGVRGFLDRLVGGPGMIRKRCSVDRMCEGERIDSWVIEKYIEGSNLRLYSIMKMPGRAWLDFEVVPSDDGPGSIIRQTAIFDAKGLIGNLYWWILKPIHGYVFGGMLRKIAERAIKID